VDFLMEGDYDFSKMEEGCVKVHRFAFEHEY